MARHDVRTHHVNLSFSMCSRTFTWGIILGTSHFTPSPCDRSTMLWCSLRLTLVPKWTVNAVYAFCVLWSSFVRLDNNCVSANRNKSFGFCHKFPTYVSSARMPIVPSFCSRHAHTISFVCWHRDLGRVRSALKLISIWMTGLLATALQPMRTTNKWADSRKRMLKKQRVKPINSLNFVCSWASIALCDSIDQKFERKKKTQ